MFKIENQLHTLKNVNKVVKCIFHLPNLEPTKNLYKPNYLLDINHIYKLKIYTILQSILDNENHSTIKFSKCKNIPT